MTQEINDGGPAFPHNERDANGQFRQHFGMTLRDYFAGQAMIGMLADPNCTDSASVLAKACYSMADSMIKARCARAKPDSAQRLSSETTTPPDNHK